MNILLGLICIFTGILFFITFIYSLFEVDLYKDIKEEFFQENPYYKQYIFIFICILFYTTVFLLASYLCMIGFLKLIN